MSASSIHRALLVASISLCAPAAAYADAGGGERSGLMFGASIGPANLDIDCSGCTDLEPLTAAVSLTAQVGAMITPRVALVVEHWAVRWDGRDDSWFGDSQDHRIQESTTTAGGQLWLTRKLWLRAGVGVARHQTDVSYRRVEGGRLPAAAGPQAPSRERPGSGRAPALVGGVGYEVIYTPEFAVDFALRGGAASKGERGVKTGTLAFTIGATWF